MVRKHIESTYIGTCDIWEKAKVKQPNGSTGFEPIQVEEDIPCRISFKSVNSTGTSNNAQAIQTVVTLFINPDLVIKPGSKLIVTQNGRTQEYGYSGEPALYGSHQEFILNSFGGYA